MNTTTRDPFKWPSRTIKQLPVCEKQASVFKIFKSLIRDKRDNIQRWGAWQIARSTRVSYNNFPYILFHCTAHMHIHRDNTYSNIPLSSFTCSKNSLALFNPWPVVQQCRFDFWKSCVIFSQCICHFLTRCMPLSHNDKWGIIDHCRVSGRRPFHILFFDVTWA